MILKNLRIFVLSLAISAVAVTMLARMTDAQVVEYVKTAKAQGKSQNVIARELFARGVTEDQITRIQSSQGGAPEQNVKQDMNVDRSKGDTKSAAVVGTVGESTQYSTSDFEEIVIEEQRVSTDEMSVRADNNRVFGQNIFRSRNLSFEPNENLATPDDYKLGPGDEVVINVWGNNEDHIRQTISPEGRIFVSQIGPIYLNGLTIDRANQIVKEMFASKYGGVADDGSDISLTLGNLRTIQVDVMGEVSIPGTYRISPFSTLFHALYNAGGTTSSGSLRNIEVLRNGRKIASSDIYDYIFNGKKSNDIRLQEGDVIIVPTYDRLVEIVGEVKQPNTFELKKGETLEDLLKYAGGMKATAYGERVSVDRVTNGAKTVAVVDVADFSSTRLDDGDVVNVGKAIDRYDNRVEIGGAVFRPGYYAINNEVKTVRDLINIAQGLKEDAFMNRAQLFRETPDKTTEIIAVDLEGLLNGSSKDIPLQKNDVLVIASKEDMNPTGDIRIMGEVQIPGSYAYARNMTIEDIIVQAGGLLEGASYATVDISRRINDPNSKTIGETIAQNYQLTIKDGLLVDGAGFVLEPNDFIDIRRSPGYIPQRRVSITGEVPFEGGYTLTRRNQRLSDLVKQAGGVSEFAYLRGAHLSRLMTPEEKESRDELLRLARSTSGNDSIAIDKILQSDRYAVGIELDKALANPGSDADLVLMEGDQLVIPELINTVKISGDVLYPNTVSYTPGKNYKYYIDQAGGFGNSANKGHVFVVYLNGTVAKGKKAVIEPGCHIIIPSKQKGKGMSVGEWLSIATTAASLGTMTATITNLIKK